MPNTIFPTPVAASEPAKAQPKPPALPPAATAPTPEHHHAGPRPVATTASAPALSSTDISYVTSLLGVVSAQRMEEILLKTGVPVPVNLGPLVDTTA
jgi:cell division septation protein DedD